MELEEYKKLKNNIFENPKANEYVISIFDTYYEPKVIVRENAVKPSLFNKIDYESVGLDLVENSYFINQFEHLLQLHQSASDFMERLDFVVKDVIKSKINERVIKNGEVDYKFVGKVLKQALDLELERYERQMGSSLRLDLLRMFGLPIKDESFTITIEVDGQEVTI